MFKKNSSLSTVISLGSISGSGIAGSKGICVLWPLKGK
jgi:hypothetical protein